jgi:hypothetical protein
MPAAFIFKDFLQPISDGQDANMHVLFSLLQWFVFLILTSYLQNTQIFFVATVSSLRTTDIRYVSRKIASKLYLQLYFDVEVFVRFR